MIAIGAVGATPRRTTLSTTALLSLSHHRACSGLQSVGRLSAASVGPRLARAFAYPGLKAVALVINSPGGSPVQSSLLYKRIRQLREESAQGAAPKIPVSAGARGGRHGWAASGRASLHA